MKQTLIILLTLITALITLPALASSIQGALVMLNDTTPYVAVPVQALGVSRYDGKSPLCASTLAILTL